LLTFNASKLSNNYYAAISQSLITQSEWYLGQQDWLGWIAEIIGLIVPGIGGFWMRRVNPDKKTTYRSGYCPGEIFRC